MSFGTHCLACVRWAQPGDSLAPAPSSFF
eukprot:COSAG02_NODE_27999_length_598_cov_1.170341_1_plen_28_part_01